MNSSNNPVALQSKWLFNPCYLSLNRVDRRSEPPTNLHLRSAVPCLPKNCTSVIPMWLTSAFRYSSNLSHPLRTTSKQKLKCSSNVFLRIPEKQFHV